VASSRGQSVFLPDTSVIVASVSSWHVHHVPAVEAIEDRLSRRERMIVAAVTLIEAYSVLTRLPAPHRLAPHIALELVDDNFARSFTSVALSAADYRTLLRAAPAGGVAGGRIYDAIVARCARKAGAHTLLTFNASDFAPFAGPDLTVAVPAR
jgi:predicted nucleic acid-binding protein